MYQGCIFKKFKKKLYSLIWMQFFATMYIILNFAIVQTYITGNLTKVKLPKWPGADLKMEWTIAHAHYTSYNITMFVN